MKGAMGTDQGRCPIDYALAIFGDRWTLLVVRDLLFKGKCHFGEIIASEEGIASNILAARLKKLETHGLISREIDPVNRKQVVYRLTDKGLALAPVLIEIVRWSGAHDPDTAAPKAFLRRAAKDREALIKETIAAAKSRAGAGRAAVATSRPRRRSRE
jgi:DNA-binding HxlR family transcriptional regulator